MGGMVLLLLGQSTDRRFAALVLTRKQKAIAWPSVRLPTGQPWFSSSNSSNVRCLTCCHIVRPAACIGSWLYQTYLLRLTTSYSIICCPNWWRRTRIFRPGKRQNLAPSMQLNRRHSWRYRKVKFMCAISFLLLLLFSKLRGTQRWFPPKCIENTFKVVQSTFDRKMHSKQRLYKFSQLG